MKLSYHVHSSWSDGKSSLEEIVKSAEEINIHELGISDHFIISPDGTYYPWSMDKRALSEYVQNIKNLKSKIPLRLGLEVDFFPETVSELKKILLKYPFDYLIGSVHVVDGILIDDNLQDLSIDQFDQLVKKYWQRVYEMCESRTFDIVGHLDLFKKFGLKSNTSMPEIEKALLSISKNKMAVEINTSGWFFPAKEQYPSTSILKKIKELDIPIIVNADAHAASNLTRGYDEAYQLLHQIGFDKQARFEKRKLYMTTLPKSL